MDWSLTSKWSKDSKVKIKIFLRRMLCFGTFFANFELFFSEDDLISGNIYGFLLRIIVMLRFRLTISQEQFQKIDEFFNFALLGTEFGIFIFISTH